MRVRALMLLSLLMHSYPFLYARMYYILRDCKRMLIDIYTAKISGARHILAVMGISLVCG